MNRFLQAWSEAQTNMAPPKKTPVLYIHRRNIMCLFLHVFVHSMFCSTDGNQLFACKGKWRRWRWWKRPRTRCCAVGLVVKDSEILLRVVVVRWILQKHVGWKKCSCDVWKWRDPWTNGCWLREWERWHWDYNWPCLKLQYQPANIDLADRWPGFRTGVCYSSAAYVCMIWPSVALIMI